MTSFSCFTALLTLCSLVLFLRVEANENVMNEVAVAAPKTLTLAAETPLSIKDEVKTQDICSSTYTCSSCTSISGCGWCASSSSCMAGYSTGASGYCSYGWSYYGTSGCSDSCRYASSCSNCYYGSGCGWCSTSSTCMSGTSFGPSSGTCSSSYWNYGTGCTSICGSYYSCESCTVLLSCDWCGSTGQCISSSNTYYCSDVRYTYSSCTKSNAALVAAIVVPIIIVVIITVIVIIIVRRRRTYTLVSQPAAVVVTTQSYQPPTNQPPTNQQTYPYNNNPYGNPGYVATQQTFQPY